MKDINQFWKDTGAKPNLKGGNTLLVGNKDIIKEDLLGIDLDKKYKESIETCTAPQFEVDRRKSFVLDES